MASRLGTAVAAFALACWSAPGSAQVQVIVGGPDPTPAPKTSRSHRHHAVAPVPTRTGPPVSYGQSSRGAGVSRTIVSYALRFVGVPYVWGGTSPRGFDCSGFVYYTYRSLGYWLPRTADLQYFVSRPVSTPLPGDLVFFQTYDYGPSHVGIYIGGGRFVSSVANDVHVSTFGDGYFAARYLGARRIAPVT